MGAVGAVEVVVVFSCMALNIFWYHIHAAQKKWRACRCLRKLLYVSNR